MSHEYDKSPFNSLPFNSTMKNTCAFFVETFTSGEIFNSPECYAFTTIKKSNHITNLAAAKMLLSMKESKNVVEY